MWNRETGRVAYVWDVPAGGTADNSAVAFDEDDTKVLYSSGERVLRWSLTNGERTDSWQVPSGLNDNLVTRPGKPPLLVRRDPWPPVPQTAIRAQDLHPEGKLTELYKLRGIDANAVEDANLFTDGRVLLVNIRAKGRAPRAHLFDGLTGKPIALDPGVLPPNYEYGRLT